MYEYLIGTVKEIYNTYIVLEVNDIGYEIFLIKNSKVTIGDELKIYIYNYINDSLNIFFGFYSQNEKSVFTDLLKVKNIGVKTAFIIMDRVDVETLLDAVNLDNDDFLLKLPKISKTNIVDLKKCLKKVQGKNIKVEILNSELFLFLKNLDYELEDILMVINEVDKNIPVNLQVKEAIKILDSKGVK